MSRMPFNATRMEEELRKNRILQQNKKREEDELLSENPVISDQKFCVFGFYREKNKLVTYKLFRFFATQDEAVQYDNHMSKNYFVYRNMGRVILEVGKWCVMCLDPAQQANATYSTLASMMKKYLQKLEESKVKFQDRVQKMKQDAEKESDGKIIFNQENNTLAEQLHKSNISVPRAGELERSELESERKKAAANKDTINPDTTNPDTTNPDTTNQDTTNPDTTNPDTTNTNNNNLNEKTNNFLPKGDIVEIESSDSDLGLESDSDSDSELESNFVPVTKNEELVSYPVQQPEELTREQLKRKKKTFKKQLKQKPQQQLFAPQDEAKYYLISFFDQYSIAALDFDSEAAEQEADKLRGVGIIGIKISGGFKNKKKAGKVDMKLRKGVLNFDKYDRALGELGRLYEWNPDYTKEKNTNIKYDTGKDFNDLILEENVGRSQMEHEKKIIEGKEFQEIVSNKQQKNTSQNVVISDDQRKRAAIARLKMRDKLEKTKAETKEKENAEELAKLQTKEKQEVETLTTLERDLRAKYDATKDLDDIQKYINSKKQ